jgi:2-keto-4-pentenoate hydratase/2-oxohepta-3-ene-1,7-dioic acid hydratase in catechol pathway
VRYATLLVDGAPHVAAADGSGFALVSGGANRSLTDVLALAPQERERALAPQGLAPEAARPLAPLRPASIVAVGLNYLDHIRETGMERPLRPLLFSKLRSSVVGPDEPVRIDGDLTRQVDWEVELAVVVGLRAQRVPLEHALDHVFGYTVANDVSARDLQFSDGQWLRGKSLDTFCPLGPFVVTADEVGDPHALGLRCRVNGATVQDSSTAEMLFGVAELISFCSHSFTLEPGDVVLTGTPWGCGAFMDPPRFLAPGDVLETEVEGIGTLRNPVEAV